MMKVKLFPQHAPKAALNEGAKYLSAVWGGASSKTGIEAYNNSLKSIVEKTHQFDGNLATTNGGFYLEKKGGVTHCLVPGHAFYLDKLNNK